MSISTHINPADVLSQAQARGQLRSLEQLRAQGATTGDARTDEQLLGLACEFEKILLQQMLSAMRKTVKSDGLFGQSLGGEVYQEMFDTAVLDQASGGFALGLAEPLYRQLIERKGVSENNPDITAG